MTTLQRRIKFEAKSCESYSWPFLVGICKRTVTTLTLTVNVKAEPDEQISDDI